MHTARSGSLAAWTSAWLAGRVSIDEVVDAITGTDAPHRVSDLDGPEPVGLHDALVALRRTGGPVRAVLPVPGDVRGVPGPTPFRSAALEAREGLVGDGRGLVPEAVSFAPSSAPPTVLWHAFVTETPPVDHQSVDEAQYDLTTAIRETATTLAAAQVAGATSGIAGALPGARRAGERLNLPPGHPPNAVALLAQAQRLQAVLELALADPAGGAVDRVGMAARTEALRPLATAVRRARLTAYNAGAGS